MLIGLVAGGGEGEEEQESHSKVGTLLGPTTMCHGNVLLLSISHF